MFINTDWGVQNRFSGKWISFKNGIKVTDNYCVRTSSHMMVFICNGLSVANLNRNTTISFSKILLFQSLTSISDTLRATLCILEINHCLFVAFSSIHLYLRCCALRVFNIHWTYFDDRMQTYPFFYFQLSILIRSHVKQKRIVSYFWFVSLLALRCVASDHKLI